eukprot:gene22620-biopygen23745
MTGRWTTKPSATVPDTEGGWRAVNSEKAHKSPWHLTRQTGRVPPKSRGDCVGDYSFVNSRRNELPPRARGTCGKGVATPRPPTASLFRPLTRVRRTRRDFYLLFFGYFGQYRHRRVPRQITYRRWAPLISSGHTVHADRFFVVSLLSVIFLQLAPLISSGHTVHTDFTLRHSCGIPAAFLFAGLGRFFPGAARPGKQLFTLKTPQFISPARFARRQDLTLRHSCGILRRVCFAGKIYSAAFLRHSAAFLRHSCSQVPACGCECGGGWRHNLIIAKTHRRPPNIRRSRGRIRGILCPDVIVGFATNHITKSVREIFTLYRGLIVLRSSVENVRRRPQPEGRFSLQIRTCIDWSGGA